MPENRIVQGGLFRQAILRSDAVSDKADVQHTLKTLRYKLFAKAGYITREGRKKSLTWPLQCNNVSGLMAFGINLKLSIFPLNSPPSSRLEIPNGKSGLNHI